MNAYFLTINLGSIFGSFLLLFFYWQKSRSWKKTIVVYLISLTALELGSFFGRLVRGLSYGTKEPVWELLTKEQGTHFIGRVIFVLLFFPLAYRLIYRTRSREWIAYLDLLCIFLAFQHMFNRMACLFEGCCMGKFYRGPFAFKYPWGRGTGAGYSYSVYPTQLFEAVCMLVLFLALLYLHKRSKRLLFVFCICFSTVIFISEFMMEGIGTIRVMGCSVIQYAAVLLMGMTGIFAVAEKYESQKKKEGRSYEKQ